VSLGRLYTELDRAIDADACVVQELVTSLAAGLDYFTIDYRRPPEERRQSYGTTSGVLGWGMPAAIGVSMGNPDREIWCLTADGSFNFGVQALWSAARYEAPVGFVVFNNGQYQANRHAMSHYPGRMQQTGRYPGVHLNHPEINYVSIAEGYGVEGESVRNPSDIAGALQRAKRVMHDGRPYLVDVRIETTGSFDDSWYDYFSIATGRNERA
jgi:benzoylformate decarboxylase